MEYEEFERRAARVWDEIPDAYRSGVDGLVLERDSRPHPTLPDIYTLGECLTESYISDWGGPETTRSVLVLYYGSFLHLSRLDPDFDWRYEIWETVTHELRHHLESLAAEDALEDVDYAVDENFKRLQGEPFDPFFYRSGEPLAPGVYQADRDVFIELPWEDRAPPGPEAEFLWHGVPYSVPVPEDPGDVAFIQVTDGVDTGPAALCVVLARRIGFWAALGRGLRGAAPDVVETEATARPMHR
ncbi:MAG TPA: hypothetical protein VMM83_04375 [Longimicrobiales bacterium]|nr:hypothetical protein [Longimicrobiales bacterium]